jgi:hypothetical protein
MKTSVNTSGSEALAAHSDLASQLTANAEVVDKDTTGTVVKAASGGANEVPDTGRVTTERKLDIGPKVDSKNSYGKATYKQVIRHSSGNANGYTEMIRQDN